MTVHAKPEDFQANPVVLVRDGHLYANSRDVAVFFEKQHRHVLRDIDNVLTQAGGVPRSGQTPWFSEVQETGQNGESYRSFDMTRSGLVLLVMGYTGSKAMALKIRYIEEFDRMEEELRRLAGEVIDFSRDEDELTAWGVPLRKLDVQARVIRTVMALEGIEYARAVARKDRTFPSARGFAIREIVDTSRDDPQGCLRHLFRQRAQSGGTIGALLDLALRDESARSALRSHGMIVDPGLKRGFVAFADSHPFLRQAFAATQWAAAWNKALLFIDPAAHRTKKTLPFSGSSSLAVLVPRDAIMSLRNNGAQ